MLDATRSSIFICITFNAYLQFGQESIGLYPFSL
jgi:hypothetical protein